MFAVGSQLSRVKINTNKLIISFHLLGFIVYLNSSFMLFFSYLSLFFFPPMSLSDLQRFPEPGARNHGPSGATCQDDPEGKNNDRPPTQKATTYSSTRLHKNYSMQNVCYSILKNSIWDYAKLATMSVESLCSN